MGETHFCLSRLQEYSPSNSVRSVKGNMHPGTAGRGINVSVIKPRSTCSQRLHFTGKLFAVNLPLSSHYMHEASFNYLNRS